MIGSYNESRVGRAMIPSAGQGCRVETESGEEYIDYILGGGPLILGHAHPAVVDAIQTQAERGTNFYPPDRSARALADKIVEAVPCAETVKFTSTGTEATYLALRLARAATGKSKVLKFVGGFHGWHDYALQSSHKADPDELANASVPEGTIDSAGIPHLPGEQVLAVPFNDLETTREIVTERHTELAAVIVEPILRSIPPVDGFLSGLRRLCDETGLVLIFDEVATGFRLSYGGAQEYYGVEPDIAAYGKIIGGGLPLGAVCGTRECMRHLVANETTTHVISGGTLRNNAVSAAAGSATLDELRKETVYDGLHEYTSELRRAVEEILGDASIPCVTLGEGPMFDYAVIDAPSIGDWEAMLAADESTKQTIDSALIDAGILTKIGTGKWYISTAHGDAELERTIETFKHAVDTTFRQGEGPAVYGDEDVTR